MIEIRHQQFDTNNYPKEYYNFLVALLLTEDIVTVHSIGDTEEIWSLEVLVRDLGLSYKVQTIYTEKDLGIENFSLGYVERGSLENLPIVYDQNASPIGIHMSRDTLAKITKIINNN